MEVSAVAKNEEPTEEEHPWEGEQPEYTPQEILD